MFGNWGISLPNLAFRPSRDTRANDIIEIIFPRLDVESFHDPTFCSDSKKMGLCALFHSIRKLPDVTPEHLRSLNISYQHDIPVEEFLPPRKQDSNSTAHGPTTWYPSEDGQTQMDQTFRDRKRELLIENNHAFESLARIRRDIKLGHFYKFYQSLELVSTYYSHPEGAIAGMPERFREEVVRNLIEPICWMFNARLSTPRGPPRVQLQKARFLTRIDMFAFLTPTLPAERKQGLVEGPLFGIQCRHEEYFIKPKSHSSEPSPTKDDAPSSTTSEPGPHPVEEPNGDNDGDIAMKEGSFLETKALIKDGAGENTNVPDSSSKGPPGAENSTLPQKKELTEEEKRKAARRLEEKEIRMKKGSWSEGDVWDAVKEIGGLLMVAQDRRKGGKGDAIGKGKVEKNVRYRAIGREDPLWDDIYLVSTLHHHVSLSHVRISSAYLRFLETGNLPNPEHPLIQDTGSEWYELKVRKTPWLDLFKGEERVETVKLIAGILNYLSRTEKVDL